ncbi:hypothetical protein GCM10009555_096950 [Acrocarpospora macrocephala]|uniref:Alpha/beta hydrolase fold-3 domain-containing protein n=1 Tax=Acrocarpospora macrocephala TaxID=150177 RepID=A0A5M3WLJ4_9ACTN|nr:alpha/beta hydrolase fold domain-containing protein [Acrocarpospora macrocephala]GES09360.1 hypothetical protein Amac_029560 [Acrocarpospora macrocephala]
MMITPAYEDPTGARTEVPQAFERGSAAASDVLVEESPVGPIVRRPGPVEFTVIYLHGNRDMSGAPEPGLDFAGRLALRTGAAVLCPRYRPEFPAALDDVHVAYDHSRAMAPVVVVGERLGAGLAAALLIRLRDLGVAPPRCAVLVSALLDLTLGAPSLLLNAGADSTFDVAELQRQVTRYAGGTPPTDPLLSPLYANLHGLPPIQLLAAGNDPLLDDSLAFAARAARAAVPVDLRVRPDGGALRARTVMDLAVFAETWTSAARSSHARH